MVAKAWENVGGDSSAGSFVVRRGLDKAEVVKIGCCGHQQ
jgi:hypothetical protein